MTRIIRTCAVAAAVLAAGCSQPATHARLSGRVAVGGKPVTDGMVLFVNADGSRSASAQINSDGKYLVPDAPLGELRVAVRTKDRATLLGPPVPEGGQVKEASKLRPSQRPNPRYVPTPAKYESFETSGLKATVAPEQAGGATVDLDL